MERDQDPVSNPHQSNQPFPENHEEHDSSEENAADIDSLLHAVDRILDAVDPVDAEQFLRRNQQHGGQ